MGFVFDVIFKSSFSPKDYIAIHLWFFHDLIFLYLIMPKSFFLHISQSKKPEFLREMADSKSATEKVQNDPGTSYCARK